MHWHPQMNQLLPPVWLHNGFACLMMIRYACYSYVDYRYGELQALPVQRILIVPTGLSPHPICPRLSRPRTTGAIVIWEVVAPSESQSFQTVVAPAQAHGSFGPISLHTKSTPCYVGSSDGVETFTILSLVALDSHIGYQFCRLALTDGLMLRRHVTLCYFPLGSW